MHTPRLVIARNTGIHLARCAICNQERHFSLGPELYRIDTLELVCLSCGKENAPELVALLSMRPLTNGYAHHVR